MTPVHSLWHDTLPVAESTLDRVPLPGSTEADVVIVGAGYTGLWTAYYLAEADPSLRIVVIEAERVGFGASGRNGGWCSALLPMGLGGVTAVHGRDAAIRLQRAMFDTVDEVGRVAAAEGIECHFAKGGYLQLARSDAQMQRIRDDLDELRSFGFGEDDHVWLSADEARQRLNATSVEGAAFTPHCAAIHPARLARGLAHAVERRGVTVHEQTRATEILPGRVITDRGTVSARFVVRATEAFTPGLKGHRRDVAPIYSLMVATEPLPESFFDEIGLRHRETFNDGRRMIVYGQRTADNRLAFGGRGAPYHFGSRVRPEFDTNDAVHDGLGETLRDLFPSLGTAAITHRWGGAVAAPRDWWCSVGLDRSTGIAWAGGYVGDGVSTTNLSGRTLSDLITGAKSDLTALAWVDHRSRRWEPEPLRWIGINSMVRLPVGADAYETRTGKPERWRSAIVGRLTGH
jgi:glycine/D-amino acid oxidase-like deaminating enzyme